MSHRARKQGSRDAETSLQCGFLWFACSFFSCLHPPSEAVIPPGTAFLFFTFLVCGALPARRRAHKRPSVQGDMHTAEFREVPSNPRRSSTVVYEPERSRKAQAGHILPVGRNSPMGAAGFTEALGLLTTEVWRSVPGAYRGSRSASREQRQEDAQLDPGKEAKRGHGAGEIHPGGGEGRRGQGGRHSRRKWPRGRAGPDRSQDMERPSDVIVHPDLAKQRVKLHHLESIPRNCSIQGKN